MEGIFSKWASTNSTIESDETMRLPKPPNAGGRAFQDFGTTQWGTHIPRPTRTSRKREVRTSQPDANADSDDEIDCLSGSNASNGDSDYVCLEKKSNTKSGPSRVGKGKGPSASSPSNGARKSAAATTRRKPKKFKKEDPIPDGQSLNTTTEQTPRPRPKPKLKLVTRNSRSHSSLLSDADDECDESRHRNESPLRIGQTKGSDDDASSKPNIKSFLDFSPLRGDDDGENTPVKPKIGGSKAKGISDFPLISPLSCHKVVVESRDKGASPLSEPDDDEDELAMRPDDHILTRGGLRPFPMEVFSANGFSSSSSSPEPPTRSSKAKRATKESSGKRSRPLREFPMNDEMFEDRISSPSPDRERPCEYSYDESKDEELMSPVADPRTLCPFCDTPLPLRPTPTLMSLISRASKHKSSYRDPRPVNPRGLRAPVQVFIGVCQRHQFESKILPEAERRGWPKTIDWGTVTGRVKCMEARLRALLDDTDHTRTGSQSTTGPRANCVFWKEAIEDIKTKGSRAIVGVSGQYANFHKIQPGYYGELGSVIIHQTLYDLFPPHNLDPTKTAPLTPDDFIRVILVPEVGLRLIIEDQGLTDLDIAEGVEILRASAKYGVAMFPEDDSEWGAQRRKGANEEISAADMILIERARRRRRELIQEEEEEEEEEEILMSKAAQKLDNMSNGGETTAGRMQKKGKGKEEDMLVSNEESRPRPLPRPKPVEGCQLYNDVLPGRKVTRISSRNLTSPTTAPDMEARVSQSHSKHKYSTRYLGPVIDLDNSESLELTDSSYSSSSPSRPGTNAEGKKREAVITDPGFHTRIAFSLSTPSKAETNMTPRGLPAPTDKSFRPLTAVRARKRQAAAISDKADKNTSDGWVHKMSAPVCSSDDDYSATSRSSLARNVPGAEPKSTTCEWLLSDSEMV